MSIPSWPELALGDGILPEPGTERERLVLWVPRDRTDAYQNWERFSSAPRATVVKAYDFCLVSATSFALRQKVHGIFFRKLWQPWQNQANRSLWTIPTGAQAEPCGERQGDCMLVWTQSPAGSVDEGALRARWPQATRIERLGNNLFCVSPDQTRAFERTPPPGPSVPPPSSPCQLRRPAEERLNLARQRGDTQALANALVDLGVVLVRQADAASAVVYLEEALPLLRSRGNRTGEADVLANLGLALLAMGQPSKARALFDQQHAIACDLADPFAQKMALEYKGQASACGADPADALANFQAALVIARQVGDQRHEAELLWSSAIAHAELNQREHVLQQGQAGVDVMQAMDNPAAGWFAEHLERYRIEPDSIGLPTRPAAKSAVAPTTVSTGVPMVVSAPVLATKGPGLLRMAISATQAMAAFVSARLRTVSTTTQRQRLQVCATCDHHTGLRCRLCGCFTTAKSVLPFERCPINKWPS